ncbi:MAG: SDR family NAD(P)-dependent oxidoreductase [Acidimicrobiales bacterium]
MQINGANVLLTGASSGIGAALAPRLAERGATVGIVARRGDRLAQVLEQCQAHAPASRMWVADLADTDAAEAVARQAATEMGGIDVLINNAAIPKRRSVTTITIDEVRETMAVNFESPVRMTLALLPHMLEQDRGVVVNVSSFGGRAGILNETAYCASKFALCGWSESMALDLWKTGVEVRLILPGAIDTEIWDVPGNDEAPFHGELHPPGPIADGIIAAIEGDAFEHYLPDMKAIAEFKTSAVDDFLAGVIAFTDQKRGQN